MVYHHRIGTIVPFVQKFYKELIIVVAAIFIASMAAMTFNASATVTSWDQGFESDSNGWIGATSRVSSGTNGVTSASGSYHAYAQGGDFSRFDGYSDVWPGTWTAEVDVYLDPSWVAGKGFDYSVAATGSDNNHQRDYIFHVTKDTSTGKLLVAGSNNTNFSTREDLESLNNYEVTSAGWYTLQHVFRDEAGSLAVDLNLLDSSSTVVFTETRTNVADTIPAEIGGNRYSWFTVINVDGGLAIDNHQLIIEAGNETEVNIYGDTAAGENQPGWMFNRDLSTSTPYAFNTNEASIGNGSIEILPISSTPSDKFIAEYFYLDEISKIKNISYDFLTANTSDADQFYLNLYVNDGSDPTEFYDCRYNIVPSATNPNPVTGFTTFTYNLNSNATNVTTRGSASINCPSNPSELASGAVLRAVAINVGDTSANDEGLTGNLDKVVVALKDGNKTTFDFEPDTTRPTAEFINPNGEVYASSVDVEFKMTDAGSGLNNMVVNIYNNSNTLIGTCGTATGLGGAYENTINCNIDVSGYADGTYVLKGGGFDVSGNNKTVSTTFIVDRTDPDQVLGLQIRRGHTASSTLLGCGGYTNSTQIRIEWDASTDPNIDYYWFGTRNNPKHAKVMAGTEFYNGNMTVNANPVYFYTVIAVDKAGNESVISDSCYVTLDQTAPAAPDPLTMKENDGELSNLTNDGFTNSYSVTTSWGSVADASYYEYSYWNDIPASPYKVGSEYTVSNGSSTSRSGVFNQGEGKHFVAVRAVDAAGNKSDWSTIFAITYDATNPFVAINDPTANEDVTGSVDVLATITDTNPWRYRIVVRDEATVAVYISDWVYDADGLNNELAGVWDTTSVVNGRYRIAIRTQDSAGNLRVRSVWVEVDNPVGNLLDEDVLGVSTDVPNNIGEEKEQEQNNGEVLAVNTENTDTTTDETSGEVLADTDTLASTGSTSYLQIFAGIMLAGLSFTAALLTKRTTK